MSIVNYGVSKHYAGSMVSDRCPLGYLLDGDVPRSTSYEVDIFQLIGFARASSHVADFNTPNKLLTKKLLNKAIGIIKFAKPFQFFLKDTMV